MKTIRRTRIITKTRELLVTRSTAGNGENQAQTVCPLCRNPLVSAF